MLYFDNAATTSMFTNHLEHLGVMQKEFFANPASRHRLGKEASLKLEAKRAEVLKLLELDEEYDLLFCSSATEANNTVIHSFKDNMTNFSNACHKSISAAVEYYTKKEKQKEYQVSQSGQLELKSLIENITDDALVLISSVNAQTGQINDIENICREIKKKNPSVHIHIDNAQGFLKNPFKYNETPFDSMSVTSHKVHGPKGVAALIFKKDANILPLIVGGGQESGMRSSTVALPLVLSFCEVIQDHFNAYAKNEIVIRDINKKFKTIIVDNFPKTKFVDSASLSPYILMTLIPEIPSDVLLRQLEQYSIYASTSSACSSKLKDNNLVFKAIRLDKKLSKHVIRFSFGLKTTMQEVDQFEKILNTIKEDLSFLF